MIPLYEVSKIFKFKEAENGMVIDRLVVGGGK